MVDYVLISAGYFLIHLYLSLNSELSFAGSSTVSTTVASANLNPPVFSPEFYGFVISEDAESGSYVGQLTATDPDEGILTLCLLIRDYTRMLDRMFFADFSVNTQPILMKLQGLFSSESPNTVKFSSKIFYS